MDKLPAELTNLAEVREALDLVISACDERMSAGDESTAKVIGQLTRVIKEMSQFYCDRITDLSTAMRVQSKLLRDLIDKLSPTEH